MENDIDIKTVVAFLLAAKKAGEQRSHDVPYEFICPACGDRAEAITDTVNGHVHARCLHCGINVTE